MATITKNCRECGARLRLQLPEGAFTRQIAEHLPVLCNSCGDAAETAEENRKLQERREAAEAMCGIPNARRLGWDQIEVDDRGSAIAAARRWAEGELNGLLLCGPVGTGKTRLAGIAAWDRVQHGHHIRWVSVARLVAMDRAGFGTNEKAQASRILTGASPLVLDDLDKVGTNATVRSLLYLAIDNRIEAGSPLLVTTNLKPDQLAETFGEAISSRLRGDCEVHVLAGADRRQLASA
jgi:DNA replication protein DnaC